MPLHSVLDQLRISGLARMPCMSKAMKVLWSAGRGLVLMGPLRFRQVVAIVPDVHAVGQPQMSGDYERLSRYMRH
ncbi:hypothetical protein BAUCODRAFT_38533 [Baudoinia panamericana UAMH 10762]|uniref:Uncharacterized protein n=1 Tax=Baudoinia panamericana (strain UAMH 10762) TaxID=717646 RepID=M2M805_BAUPA|nr:uncharacterized protein BAUCODRAFT_38533 [Baudoinia panamericana UAMH 10762]EMC92466.1 hypothetical protein BAUCODRAFT_38533 [Baudoinia panamericana UAMH 10762]